MASWKLVNTGSRNACFLTASSHYMNQYWFIFNWTTGKMKNPLQSNHFHSRECIYNCRPNTGAITVCSTLGVCRLVKFKSSRTGDAYMREWIWSSLIRIMKVYRCYEESVWAYANSRPFVHGIIQSPTGVRYLYYTSKPFDTNLLQQLSRTGTLLFWVRTDTGQGNAYSSYFVIVDLKSQLQHTLWYYHHTLQWSLYRKWDVNEHNKHTMTALTTLWTHNRHPIARPRRRAMVRLLWYFWTKLTPFNQVLNNVLALAVSNLSLIVHNKTH